MSNAVAYVVITPTRDEAANLPLLAEAIERQTVLPRRWVIVDNGSTDGTAELARNLASKHSWVDVLALPGEEIAVRGRPIVRALHLGIASLAAAPAPDFVVNVDADVSFSADYFERLLREFEANLALGIASGSAYEERNGRWSRRHVTGSSVWGATRAYRWTCLHDVLPFEERLGWDGVDTLKANARGWTTRTFLDIPFFHHRKEGTRDRSLWHMHAEQGRAAYYIGYRPYYLVLRALYHTCRETAALAMIYGYSRGVLGRAARLPDGRAVAYLRAQQSLRNLPLRFLEAVGRSSSRACSASPARRSEHRASLRSALVSVKKSGAFARSSRRRWLAPREPRPKTSGVPGDAPPAWLIQLAERMQARLDRARGWFGSNNQAREKQARAHNEVRGRRETVGFERKWGIYYLPALLLLVIWLVFVALWQHA
jgi:glycosyltransferase involved in cell wall biosynthesis